MLPRSVDRVTLLAFAVATLILGVNWVGVRFSNRELPPLWGASLRFLAASVILFAVVAMRGIALPRGRALTGALVWGALVFGLNFGLLYWALVTVTAGMTSVIFATTPLMTLFVSALAGFERITTQSIVGAVVAVAGLVVIFSGQLTADVTTAGVIAILLAALTAASSTIVVKSFPRTHPISTTAIGMGTGAVLLLLASFIIGEPKTLPQQMQTWSAVAYLVGSSIIGFSLMVFVILRWTPSASSYGIVISPVVAVAMGTLLAGEVFGPIFFVGAAIVGVGVY
ncbi:MAG: DMT family transporter, partial [Candidatus Binatia bacterium]